MIGLPQQYDSPVHLPFNRACLADSLVLQAPSNDPGGAGVSLMLRGHKLLLESTAQGLVLPADLSGERESLYLGLWQGQPCRLYVLSREEIIPPGLQGFSLIDDQPSLPIELFSLGGLGRMVQHWVERSRFCGGCGREMSWLPGEWGRHCSACEAHYFPPIHPCAIVLVRRADEVLLTRKSNWAPNRYSLVAGFQEFAESLEETAVREVREETGVTVGNLRYVGSQCWPFPSQVMVGFVADYLAGELAVDTSELDDARWFHVSALPDLPPKRSIARYILDTALKLA